MNSKYIAPLSAFLLAIGISAGAALADGNVTCTSEPKEKWQDQAKAEEAAKAAGYDVRKIEVTNGCYEVYGVKDGSLFELFYNPVDLTLKATVKK